MNGARAAAAALTALLASGPALASDMLVESAAPLPGGYTTGYALNAQQFLGVRFQNTAPWRVDRVGGHIFQLEGDSDALFVALVPLDGPDDLPDTNDLSDAIWSTTFEALPGSADVLVDSGAYLEPGWWGLVFGGGILGSDGSGGMVAEHAHYGYPSYFRFQQDAWVDGGSPGKRFLLEGEVACLEDTADTAVQCNEDCFDGNDNDADGLFDCQDEDCWFFSECCDADGDGFLRDEALCGWGGDCDDRYLDGVLIHPGAGEIPDDGIDQDCDGVESCPADVDFDGYGSPTATALSTDMTCEVPGVSTTTDDCRDVGDGASLAYPGAPEIPGDGIDQDCDGVDACYVDLDGDGFGGFTVAEGTGLDCSLDPGLSASNDDCDDEGPDAASIFPGAPEIVADDVDQDCDGVDACYLDADFDGHGAATIVPGTALSCGEAATTAATADDCDDADGTVSPSRAELPGDGIDQDCDAVDDCYVDGDGDGFGGATVVLGTALTCDPAAGLSSLTGDCLDAGPQAAQVYPGAPEISGDGIDQDCNGADTCFFDHDGDGFGGPTPTPGPSLDCDLHPGMSSDPTDCKDVGIGAQDIFPGAPEIAMDGIDQDCDGVDGCFVDDDGDGYGGEAVMPAGPGEVCGDDPGEGAAGGDCDDADPSISPGAAEVVADGIDNDCDATYACWRDDDADAFGTGEVVLLPTSHCPSAPGGAAVDGDCDDTDPATFPGAFDLPYDTVDQDCDGADRIDVDGDGFIGMPAGGDDCNDVVATVHPGAVEVANGYDDDCDLAVDEGTPQRDDDGDGFAEAGGDCDDDRPDVSPVGIEVCDGVDQDCDGRIDDHTPCYDDDADGWTEVDGDCHDGNDAIHPGRVEIPGNGIDDDCDGVLVGEATDEDGDGWMPASGDCGPSDGTTWPGAPELPDGVDNDCDGVVDEGTVLVDDDGDGFAELDGDCHDGDPAIHRDAVEILNGKDDDCDGDVDEVGPWLDADGDNQPASVDCDDTDPEIGLGRPEVANGVDDDCDGAIDEGLVDADQDGWRIDQGDCNDRSGWANPERAEVCDGIDNDCDGVVDEGCPSRAAVEGPAPGPATSCASAPGTPGSLGLWMVAVGLVAGRRREERPRASLPDRSRIG